LVSQSVAGQQQSWDEQEKEAANDKKKETMLIPYPAHKPTANTHPSIYLANLQHICPLKAPSDLCIVAKIPLVTCVHRHGVEEVGSVVGNQAVWLEAITTSTQERRL
jgi:hypothetical protein